MAALTAVLRSWAYEVRVLAPLHRRFRRRLSAAGVPSQQAPEPSGTSIRARWTDARTLAESLRAESPMLMHAHGFRPALGAILAARALPRPTPVVCSPHFLPHLLRDDPRVGLRKQAYRWILRRCDALVVPTETQQAQLSVIDEAAADRAEIVPYGISRAGPADSLDLGQRRQLLGMTSAAAIVGCVADSTAFAQVVSFLDAAAHVCMEYPSLEFVLIGSDVDRARYHDLAHERGLMGATAFVNPGERFNAAISALNVLVIPQPGWPSGMLALQALSHGVGVVALEDGEVHEMLPDAPEVTIAPADGAAALGEGIICQLQATAARMEPGGETVGTPEGSPFLVSRDFYDLGESWATPTHGSRQQDAQRPDPTRAFDATSAARALIAVYHDLLDGA